MDRRTFLGGMALTTAAAAAPSLAEAAGAEAVAVPTSDRHGHGPLWTWSAVQLASALRRRTVSAREVTLSCLERLHEVNPKVNAVVEVFEAEALAAADAADRLLRRRHARLPPLLGIPMTTKINTDQQGHATTNGVPAFKDVIAPSDSAVIGNLRGAGAIFIGRTNVPAFSFRYFSDNELYGRTLNPWNPGVTPGGSSGGAACAVAVGIGPLSQGTDIAGSVRYPGYACGVPGIRSSLGRVPTFNPTAAANLRTLTGQLFSVQGLLARTVADLRLSLPAAAVPDVRDPWSVGMPWESDRRTNRPRVAVVRRLPGIEPDRAVARGLSVAVQALRRAGYEVDEVVPPRLVEAAQLWSPLVITEARFGLVPLIEKYGDAAVKNEIASWLQLSPELDTAQFSADWGVRDQILREWRVFMQQYPVIVTPVSWRTQFSTVPVDEDQLGPAVFSTMLQANQCLLAVAALSLPGLSVPTGIVDGLPTAVQVVADRFREDRCFDVGQVIEAAVDMGTPIDPRT